MKTQQRKMIAHGAVSILIDLASGFGLVMSLVSGFDRRGFSDSGSM